MGYHVIEESRLESLSSQKIPKAMRNEHIENEHNWYGELDNLKKKKNYFQLNNRRFSVPIAFQHRSISSIVCLLPFAAEPIVVVK